MFMLEIISMCLNLITIGLTVYELFWKKSSNNIRQYIQNNYIQQINPKYYIETSIFYEVDKLDNNDVQNAHQKSERITYIAIYLIYISMAINFISYIKTNINNSLTDIIAIIYIPLRNTMIQLSVILILFCIIMIIRGWNKQQNILANFISMKYFSLKILMDVFSIVGFMLVDYSFLEKVYTNAQNKIYLFYVMIWIWLFLCQILWLQFTISKLNKFVSVSNIYENKKNKLFSVAPVYIASLLFLVITVYLKFF